MFFDTETKSRLTYFTPDNKVMSDSLDSPLFNDDLKSGEKLRMKMAWTDFARYDREKGFTGDQWNFWTDTERLWKYVVSLSVKGSPLHIVAHNIFFDEQCSDFFYWLTKWGWCLKFTYDKGMIYVLTIHKGPLVIKCMSSTNFFPFSLQKLGDMLGLPKLEVDFKKSSRSDLIGYCKRDVQILRKAMGYYLSLLTEHDLGSFKLSRASQAFNSFRYRFMDHKIYLHKHDEVTPLEQSGYFGGRVESRFLGYCKGSGFVHLDVNSMYPFVMRKYPVPVRLIDHGSYCEEKKMLDLLKSYCCMANVDLQTDDPAYAMRYRGKLVFPTGKFTTTLCSEGLKRAIKNKHLKNINSYSVYERAVIFRDYVNYWHGLKKRYDKTGNTVMKEISKNFLNYLYGKFAQQIDIVEMYDDITYDGYWREDVFDLVTRQTEITTKMFNCIFRTFGRLPSKTYFAAIASHITEYARFRLYDLMSIAGIENILYCDTDSLKMKAEFLPLYKNVIDPDRLGYLKLEDTTKHLAIFGAKYYTTEKVKKIKGVPTKAEHHGGHKYSYTEFFRQAHHLRNQITRFMTIRKVTKTVKPFYDKGKVLNDGTIVPFRF